MKTASTALTQPPKKVVCSLSPNIEHGHSLTHIAPGQTRVRAGRPLPYVSSPGLSWGGAVRRCVSPESKSVACSKELVRPATEAQDGDRR